MQPIIDISSSGRILIEDRVFYPSANGIDGLIENEHTHERALLKKCDDPEWIKATEDFECEVLQNKEDSRVLKNVLVPRIFRRDGGEGEPDEFYLLTELPEDWMDEDIHPLSKAFSAAGFSIYNRVLAGLRLAEILCVFQKHIGKAILSIQPEQIYINTQTGEVFIWAEQWLRSISGKEETGCAGFPPEWFAREEKVFDRQDLQFFAAYAIFRLLCGDDPFDGSETLLEFPLLTPQAVRAIGAGGYRFVLAKGENANAGCEYIGKGMLRKWKAFPDFIRSEFERTFTAGVEQREERPDLSQWVQTMRKLRDCLVFVNGQFRFCDPDVSNPVLFMQVDDYKIPVWPKKAVYWYHVDLPLHESSNGVVAGISVKNDKYYLNNLSGSVWGATLKNTTLWIYPENDVEVVKDLVIRFENKKELKIVSGQFPDPPNAIDLTGTQLLAGVTFGAEFAAGSVAARQTAADAEPEGGEQQRQ